MGPFLCLAKENYKALPGRPHRENFPPHTGLGIQPRHCSLWWELQPRTQVPLGSHILVHSYVPVPGGFIHRSIYWGPSAEAFLRCFCWNLIRGSKDHEDILFFTLAQYLVLLPTYFFPIAFFPSPGFMKLQEPFVWGSLGSETSPHLCWSTSPSTCPSLGLKMKWGSQWCWALAYTIVVSDVRLNHYFDFGLLS